MLEFHYFTWALRFPEHKYHKAPTASQAVEALIANILKMPTKTEYRHPYHQTSPHHL